jgi:hypothetical protein
VGTLNQDQSREGNTIQADNFTSTLLDRPQYFAQRRTILAGIRLSF